MYRDITPEATAGIEPAMEVLQTSALPLGYVARAPGQVYRAKTGGEVCPRVRVAAGYRIRASVSTSAATSAAPSRR